MATGNNHHVRKRAPEAAMDMGKDRQTGVQALLWTTIVTETDGETGES
jgi:hypothetical protein